MGRGSLSGRIVGFKPQVELFRSLFRDVLTGNGVLGLLALASKFFYPVHSIPDFLFLLFIAAGALTTLAWLCFAIYTSIDEVHSDNGCSWTWLYICVYTFTAIISCALTIMLIGYK